MLAQKQGIFLQDLETVIDFVLGKIEEIVVGVFVYFYDVVVFHTFVLVVDVLEPPLFFLPFELDGSVYQAAFQIKHHKRFFAVVVA